MGVRNYLIEGVSGAGKTAVAEELRRRGYLAIHGDRELAYRGDPRTGLPLAPPTEPPTARWLYEHHIWDVEKVRAHVASRDAPLTFFCGGSRNLATFVGLFDGVFILAVDRETMNLRIDERVARDPGDFGGTPEERALIAELFASEADIPTVGIRIDATAPIERVVDAILAKCAEGDWSRGCGLR